MLTSLGLILLCALLLGGLCAKLRLPPLLGMLVTGILLGPYALNVIDGKLLDISAELRQAALVVILLRAGLSLSPQDLKKVGRPALLMCFVPASFEIAGMLLLAPPLLGISLLQAGILGCVVAAVSPAVVVPRMLRLQEEGYGTDKNIPQLIMAGASVDDVYVIVLFTALTSLAQGGEAAQRPIALQVAGVPVAILLGIAAGLALGLALSLVFKKLRMRDTAKVLILFACAFLLIALENLLKPVVPFSGLLAVMAAGVGLLQFYPPLAKRLSVKFSKVWVGAELLLFVLVGATVNIQQAVYSGLSITAVLLLVLLVRMMGVYVSLLATPLSFKERLFCMLAYCPKATVQAAIGGIPLAMGLPGGEIILTAAVLAILITAPLGALAIDSSYKKLLNHTPPKP